MKNREPEVEKRFVLKDGRTPAGAARRYIYAVLAVALDNDLRDRGGFVRGGLGFADDRLALREARKVVDEMLRKAAK